VRFSELNREITNFRYIMETNVYETGDMVRVLEIKADASDLETDIRLALRELQSKARLRGFRQGNVPIKMIRNMFAKEVKEIVIDRLVREVFEDVISGTGKYEIIGSIHEIFRDYKLDGDLLIRIEFYVIPKIEVKDLIGQVLELPLCEITDSTVNFFIKSRLANHLEPRPLREGEVIGEEDVGIMDQVTFEMIRVDHDTGYVLIGQPSDTKEKFFDYGNAEYMGPEYDAYRDLFTGSTVGDELIIDEPKGHSSIEVELSDSDYRAKVIEAYRFDWPTIDNEWAGKITDGSLSSGELLDQWAKTYLELRFDGMNDRVKVNAMASRIQELYPFSIPSELIDSIQEELDSIQEESSMPRDQVLQNFRFGIVLSAIKGQLSQLVHEQSSESSDQSIVPTELTYDELVSALLDQFELKYTPISDSNVLYLIAIESKRLKYLLRE